MSRFSRRDFLKIFTNSSFTLAGLLGLGGLIKFLSYQFDAAPPTKFDIGPAAQYPPGSRTVVAHIPAIVINDHSGLRAISLVCTHLGCTIKDDLQGFTCPCHGSRYDLDGLTLKGPAAQPLKKLRVKETEAGTLRVYTS